MSFVACRLMCMCIAAFAILAPGWKTFVICEMLGLAACCGIKMYHCVVRRDQMSANE
jgi:hypothetical protein